MVGHCLLLFKVDRELLVLCSLYQLLQQRQILLLGVRCYVEVLCDVVLERLVAMGEEEFLSMDEGEEDRGPGEDSPYHVLSIATSGYFRPEVILHVENGHLVHILGVSLW